MRASDTHRTSTGSSFVTLSLGAPTRTLSRDASNPPKTSVDPTTSPRSSGPARDDDAAASTRRTHSLVVPSLSTMRDSGRVRHVCADAETDARNGRVLPPSERPERSDSGRGWRIFPSRKRRVAMAARVGVLIARQGGRGRREAHDVIVTYPVVERGRRPGIHPTATQRLARLGPPRSLSANGCRRVCVFRLGLFPPAAGGDAPPDHRARRSRPMHPMRPRVDLHA